MERQDTNLSPLTAWEKEGATIQVNKMKLVKLLMNCQGLNMG